MRIAWSTLALALVACSGDDAAVTLAGDDAGNDASAIDAGGEVGPIDAAIDADAAVAVVPYACPDVASGAVFVSESPPPATVAPWESLSASVTFANCSSDTWKAVPRDAPTGTKLGSVPHDIATWWGPTRIALPADVPPAHAVTIPMALRVSAITGPHPYQWAMVDEGVAWLDAPSPAHVVDVEVTAKTATICPGVSADVGGIASASAQVQQCIDAAAAGGTLALPAGIYRITTAISIAKPLTLTTAGASGPPGCLAEGGPPCVVLRADDGLDLPSAFFQLAGSAVTIDHVVIDGNRDKRVGGPAAAKCAAGNNQPGVNAAANGCSACAFTYGASIRAVCGTSLGWGGDSAVIRGNVIRDNGDHTTQNLWSDGLTLGIGPSALVEDNWFLDNSDVNCILGAGQNARVQNNVIMQSRQASFAGFMLDNFNGATSGDFTGLVFTNNVVQCGAQQCDFAVEVGPHPWYLSANTIGGTITKNQIYGGKFVIDVEGGGTAAQPVVVTQNTMGPAPAQATFNCGARATTAFNVSPDAHVDVQGGQAPTGSITFHGCP